MVSLNLDEQLKQLKKALTAWEKVRDLKFSKIIRDASIQRYEFSFELLWKTIKIYLKDYQKVDCFSPNNCFRKLRNLLGLKENDIEICLKMVDDRNFAIHTYSEEMADVLYKKLDMYYKITKKIYSKISEEIS